MCLHINDALYDQTYSVRTVFGSKMKAEHDGHTPVNEHISIL
jgi:hypothetical protein